jgi:3-deoxy-7-phosphoheptulonate synthase
MKQVGITKNILDISNWRNYIKKHMHFLEIENEFFFKEIMQTLKQKEPIVSANSIDNLTVSLSNLQVENGFILQVGECAESFDSFSEADILQKIEMMLDLANIFNNKNIIKIGRIAGQYNKPRSEYFETKNNTTLPQYFGDMINEFYFNEVNRKLDPKRMLLAYDFSHKTYAIILQFLNKNPKENLFISHEALNLFYEEAMTKKINNKHYNTSAHMLWLGNRTRFIGSAHIEYLKLIENPIGIKISNSTTIHDTIEIIKQLNPKNIAGKIILINRMGAKNTKVYLQSYIKAIKESGLSVLWIIDPMHGNTIKLSNGLKTRFFTDIIQEIKDFVSILKDNKVYFAGIHLESTYLDNTECAFSNSDDVENFVKQKYLANCDPRLNYTQSKEIINLLKTLI